MTQLFQKIKAIFGLREILLVGGLCSFAYGLFLFLPWVSYTVTGCLLMAAGFFMRGE